MVRLDWQKISMRLLAVLLAFVMWLYVSNEQNPVREMVLNVELEYNEPSQNYFITGGMTESVKVKVQGNRDDMNNLTAADLRAVVNIPEGKTGELVLPVEVTAPYKLKVVQVTPEEVTISLDRMVEKQVAVVVSLQGTAAQGYTALAPVCRPETVTIRGPSRVVNDINQVTAAVDIQNAAQEIVQTAAVNSLSAQVVLNPSSVQVTVPVIAALASKTVTVTPQLIGSVMEGYRVVKSTSDPVVVTIFGAPDAINHITALQTEPVDVQGAGQNLSKEVGLSIPAGVTAAQPSRVNVLVEVDMVEETPPASSEESDNT
ncbi:MAG: hypothetical protein GX949_04700 [Peptococcaceae bacterium]|nr:hypothetical protein [Peptococcaceae bacterium]